MTLVVSYFLVIFMLSSSTHITSSESIEVASPARCVELQQEVTPLLKDNTAIADFAFICVTNTLNARAKENT